MIEAVRDLLNEIEALKEENDNLKDDVKEYNRIKDVCTEHHRTIRKLMKKLETIQVYLSTQVERYSDNCLEHEVISGIFNHVTDIMEEDYD